MQHNGEVQVYSKAESHYWIVPVFNTGGPLQLSTQLSLEKGEEIDTVQLKFLFLILI